MLPNCDDRGRRRSIQVVVSPPTGVNPLSLSATIPNHSNSGPPSPNSLSISQTITRDRKHSYGGGGVSPRSPVMRLLGVSPRKSRSPSINEDGPPDANLILTGMLGVPSRRFTDSIDSWSLANNLYTGDYTWKMEPSMFDRIRGFIYEEGKKGVKSTTSTDLSIMQPLKCVPWYALYFYGKEHHNYIGSTSGSHVDNFIVSVIKEEPETPASLSPKSVSHWSTYKVLVRTKDGDEKKSISLRNSVLFQNKIRIQEILSQGFPQLAKKKPKKMKDPILCDELKHFEERQVTNTYKFGVLYCAPGQTDEEEMFCNKKGSPDFEEFLEVLGDRIELLGWPYFKGGLDIKTSTTGLESVYTQFRDFEIMYHIAPFLPYNDKDTQQVEKKRHLGNDVVVIIFKEGDQKINPECIKSHFNHIICVVQKVTKKGADPDQTFYRVGIANKDGVLPYNPELPDTPIIEKSLLREFLLTKLVNGEDTAMNAPSFKMRILRTRIGLLQEICEKYVHHS